MGLVLSNLVFKGKSFGILVMELPGYHMPILRDLLRYAKNRTKVFIHNAGTIIVVFSVVIWLLLNLPLASRRRRIAISVRSAAPWLPYCSRPVLGTGKPAVRW